MLYTLTLFAQRRTQRAGFGAVRVLTVPATAKYSTENESTLPSERGRLRTQKQTKGKTFCRHKTLKITHGIYLPLGKLHSFAFRASSLRICTVRRPYGAAVEGGALTDQVLGGHLGLLVEHEVQRREGAKGGQRCQVTLERRGCTRPDNGAVTERGGQGHSIWFKGMPIPNNGKKPRT